MDSLVLTHAAMGSLVARLISRKAAQFESLVWQSPISRAVWRL